MPTVFFHCCVSALGQALGTVRPGTLLSLVGPRHCGQSAAATAREKADRPAATRSSPRIFILHLPPSFRELLSEPGGHCLIQPPGRSKGSLFAAAPRQGLRQRPPIFPRRRRGSSPGRE